MSRGRSRRCLGTNELLRADLRAADVRATITRPGRVQLNDSPVMVTATPCRFGGERLWFQCPKCGRGVLVLYRMPAVPRGTLLNPRQMPTDVPHVWRCRRCLRLTYPSQRLSRDRMGYAQAAIVRLNRRVDPLWNYSDPHPHKPKRMRWATWDRFCERVQRHEEALDDHMAETLERFSGKAG